MKATDVSAAAVGRSGSGRNLMLMGVVLALAIAAGVGSGASSAGADEGCPNEAIRVAQHATQTGDCRAFERVSPAEKGDGDIIGEDESTMASANGNAAAFESLHLFGDAVGSGSAARTTYLARRGVGGWSTHSITPMPDPETVQILFASNRIEMFAEDLSNALMWAYDLPAVADDQPQRENIYSEDTATGALRTVTKPQTEEELMPSAFLTTDFSGYSDDAKHLGFQYYGKLLPEAGAERPNVYKWDDGTLSVAGLLPDGSVPPAGANEVYPSQIKGTMSADGTRLVFSASPDGSAPSQLYLHVDGKPSVWISEPELESGDKTPLSGIQFEGMTPDGNNIFFSSEQPLVTADTGPGPDMYRFTYSADAASAPGNLTLITNDGSALYDAGGFGGTLVGMSDNAKRVYLHDAGGKLKLWEEGVPGLTTVDPNAPRPVASDWLTLVNSRPGYSRVSPDGNWLAYVKAGQMYVYDRGGQSLTCVSCPSDAVVVPSVTESGGRFLEGFRPRFLSDTGKVFFSTTGSLLPADTNGVADVYEYDGPTGKLSLLTSGKGSEPMMFADASKDGSDVFFVTRQQLVPSDTDEYVDVYDARAGGGFDEPESPPTAPCSGEACQPASGASPSSPTVASGDATRGNLKQRRHHKAKKHHKHHKRHHRAAGTNRRAYK